MKILYKYIYICFFTSLITQSAFQNNESYYIEEYLFKWKYEQIGDVNIEIQLSELNTSISLCTSTTSCVVLSAQEAKSLSSGLSDINAYYSRFKKHEGDITETHIIIPGKLELIYSKDITNGFRVKVYDKKNWDYVYLSKKEARKLGNHLKDTDNLFSFVKNKLAECLD